MKRISETEDLELLLATAFTAVGYLIGTLAFLVNLG
jgi:hypothetical protein